MAMVSSSAVKCFRSGVMLLAFLLFPFPSVAAELVPRLVRDIDLTTYTAGSSPRQAVDLNKGFAFTAFGNRELWMYDGHEDLFTTVLRRQEILLLGSGIYAARDASGWTLWEPDGYPYFHVQPLTTQPVASVGPAYLTGSGVWLFEADAGRGRGLWTVRQKKPVEVARPLPLSDGRLLHDLMHFRNRTFFVARDRRLGTSLWSTDGAPGGTKPFFAPFPGQTVSMTLAGVLQNRLLLTVSGGGEAALWTSDGTPRGTRRLVRIGTQGARITDVMVPPVSPRGYFAADDGQHGKQLWVTDGTAAGTRRLTSFTAGDPFAGSPLAPIFLDGRFAFFADDGVHGREIWWTDGTAAGTRLLADVCPGSCGTSGRLLGILPSLDTPSRPERLIFSARTAGDGVELWAADGTAAGTVLLAGDLCGGPCSGDPQDAEVSYFSTAGSGISFTVGSPAGERALWFSDGTPERTWRLTPPGATVTSLHPLAVSDAAFGDEFWETDGTPEGTHLWRDLGREIDSGSHPAFLGTAGDRAVLSAFTPARGRTLFASDGTAAGTFRLPVPQPGPDANRVITKASAAGSTFFAAPVRGGDAPALWATDGTAAGVVRLTPPGVTVAAGPFAAGGRAVFFATDAAHGTELWSSGGTPESTQLAADLVPGPESPGGTGAVGVLQGRLLFGRADDSHLWITDGTAEGTGRLIDAAPFLAPLDNAPHPAFAEIPGKLFFLGSATPGAAPELWVSDGSAAGTQSLGFSPPGGQDVTGFYPAATRLYFLTGCTDTSCLEPSHLWLTDGTPGSVAQAPMTPDTNGGIPPVTVGDRLVFGDVTTALWVTDGTAAGTFPLHDPAGNAVLIPDGRAASFAGRLIAATDLAEGGFSPCYAWNGQEGDGATATPAPGVLCNGDFFPAGSRLYFTGFAPATGAEPWVFEVSPQTSAKRSKS